MKITSQMIAQSIASRAQTLAQGMELYQHQLRWGGHDEHVASLDVVFDRLVSDWQTFMRKRNEEANAIVVSTSEVVKNWKIY